MKKILFLTSFTFILLLGFFLRFYQLGKVPDSLDWDEVAIGYNAYSLLSTGRDEFGKFMPITFRSFNDYKPPLYIYLTVPSVALFGLTPFAVRLPSALFGFLSVSFVYLLVYKLFKDHPQAKLFALLSMLFFAISPWSIQFSRVAFEANVALFFVISGAAFFITGIREKNTKWIFLSTFLLACSMYAYHTEKLFTPILLISLLLWGFWGKVKDKKVLLVFLLIFFAVLNLPWLLDIKAIARGTSVSFTGNQSLLQHSIIETQQDISSGNTVFIFFHNRRFIFIDTFIQNYLLHFSPNWLFITGDLARHHAPGMGDLYLLSLPMLLFGFYFFIRHFGKKLWILLCWFFAAPLASALAIDAPHAIRSFVMLPMWQICEAVGYVGLLLSLKRKWQYIFCGILSFCLLLNFVYYCDQYFIHTNTDDQPYWQYGYLQAMQIVGQKKDNTIMIDDTIQQGYIYYLFANKIDPKIYLAKGGTEALLKHCVEFGNVYFNLCGPLTKGEYLVTAEKKQYTVINITAYANSVPAVYIYRK